MQAAAIRVLVVDDHPVVADGLALVLESDPIVSVAGTAGSVEEATRKAVELRPDVVVIDYYLGDGTAADAASAIREQLWNVPFVVLTADGADETLLHAVEAGASAFLLKAQASTEIRQAVRRAAEGEMLIPAATLARLLGQQRRKEREAAEHRRFFGEPLTIREREVLSLMADGLDNRAIADRLVVSYTTVRSHVQKVLEKLSAHSKLEAVARANEYGLLSA